MSAKPLGFGIWGTGMIAEFHAKALAEIESGQLLKVVATDAGSVRDFQAFARQTGNELVEQSTAGSEYIHVLRRR